ncbi:MAG TPA: ABC transporter ATP-binding protein [Myxococcales bacterium]|nr:ABC transporter ATP-binding protein [Myxococcales bacterium]
MTPGPAAGMPALEVVGLKKIYRARGGAAVVAVDDLSFAVRPGEIVGLLGPNGAGKTTAMQLALALLDPDAGEARLFGGDPELLGARRRVGYAPDAPLFPRKLTGLQILDLHARLLGFGPVEARRRAERFADQVGLAEPARRPAGTLSRGQAQRLGLALALLGDPDLLLLDEPTAGLDPAAMAAMRELLVAQRAKGTAVLLNSHLLSEVERVCDRVLFLKQGRLLHTHEVRAGQRTLEVRLANAAAISGPLAQAVPEGKSEGDRFRAAVESEDQVPPIIRRLVDAGAEILEARLVGAELEQLYLQIVEGRA